MTHVVRDLEDPSNDIIGSTINGEWNVVEPLSRGGDTVVYLAYGKDDTPVIVKAAGPNDVGELLNEYMVYTMLRNQSVAQFCDIYYIGKHCNYFTLVMKHLGSTVSAQCTRYGKYSVPRAMHIGIQILTQLEAMSMCGIAHDALHEGNLTVTSSDEVQMIDFGHSKWLNREVQTFYKPLFDKDGKFLGTVEHKSSPWLFKDDLKRLATMLVDITAAGCTRTSDHYITSYLQDIGDEDAMIDFNEYIENLPFGQMPNYEYLRYLLKTVCS